jgi:hypothetical protein
MAFRTPVVVGRAVVELVWVVGPALLFRAVVFVGAGGIELTWVQYVL